MDKYLVRLEKSAPAMVALNENYDYSYTVVAKDKVKKVVVEEQIPAGTSYVSSNPEADVSGNKVTWTLYNLQKGDNVAPKLTVKPTEVADLSNCATITAYPEACTTTQVGVPKLAIVKTTPNEQVLLGAGVPWNITVTNTGNFCAYDVVVTDTLPAGVSHASGEKVLTTELGTLAPGESRDITINTEAAATGEHCNVAGESKSFELTVLGLQGGTYCNQVSASSAEYGLSGSDDACTEWRGYPALLIEVIDTEDPLLIGEQTTYVIQITNQGTAQDTNVTLNVALPSQLKVVSAAGATKGTISGNNVSFAAYPVLQAKEIIEFRVVAEAVSEGDARFKASMDSDLLRSPVPEEEATQVY